PRMSALVALGFAMSEASVEPVYMPGTADRTIVHRLSAEHGSCPPDPALRWPLSGFDPECVYPLGRQRGLHGADCRQPA
ncbi:MAG TPA: hypothetical protein VLC97_17370, partial [Rhodanobacteraceae bacterium]|nr:hypothetical protein [Rhodanobacteraceae bacterium]